MFMSMPDAGKSGAANVANVVDEFPILALPPIMRHMAKETAEVALVSVGLPACAALATVSASLGRGLAIPSDVDRETYGNLYIIAGAGSGSGKSVTFKGVLAPVFAYQTTLRAEALKARPGLKAQLFTSEKTIRKANSEKACLDHNELAALIEQRDSIKMKLNKQEPAVVCEDVTPPALHRLLAENSEVMFSASGDARHSIHVVARDRDDNPYLKAWSGDPTEVARITRNSVSLHAPRMALFWLPQPDVMLDMFTRRVLTANGFLPRVLPYLMDYTPVESGYDIRRVSPKTKENWSDLVRGLFETYHAKQGQPSILKRSKQVQKALIDYRNSVVRRLHSELADVAPYASRWAEQAWRLTLVLHAGRHGPKAHNETVQSSTAKDAILLMDFFSRQQLPLLSSSLDRAKTENEVAILNKLLVKKEMTARDFAHDHVMKSTTEAKALLEQLVAGGKVDYRDQTPTRGGVSTRYYRRK
jgi:hypothetical protein